MQNRLEDKIAVVTGASSGIGRSIVEHYVAEGAKVVAFARNQEALNALAAAYPGKVLAVVGDVTQAADLQRLVEETVKAFGGIDILVPNAGIARVVSFADSTAEACHTQFSVNLFGAIETVRLFLPHIRRGGSVQFITTFLTQVGFPGLAIYSASKAALKSMSQSLAKYLAPYGISVGVVAPGFVPTALARDALSGQSGVEIRAQSPFNRVARPEEVAYAVLFLASAEAEFMTGAIIDVNGASYLRT